MSESTDYIAQLPTSPHPAEKLLQLSVELITRTTDVAQLSDTSIEAALGIQLESFEEDREDYAARLTPEWNVAVVVSDDEIHGRIVELGFFDSGEDTVADLTEICGIDSQSFSTALVEAGFEQRLVHGIHGDPKGRQYDRGRVRVLTQTRGEANQPHDKVSHECITSVWIRRG